MKRITIVGAGLSGLPMAMLLARRGHLVDVYESRPDPRVKRLEGARSINLTFAERGLATLRVLGLEERVLEQYCTPLRGRAVHDEDGQIRHLPYGLRENEVLHAVSRVALTKFLTGVAEQRPGVRLHFGQRCVGLDPATATATFVDQNTDSRAQVAADMVIGADGAYSTVRRLMQRGQLADFNQHYIPWRYKELVITPEAAKSGGFDKNALHVWPRGPHMMFGLPNTDWSFNAVCVLPDEEGTGFDSLGTPAEAVAFFERSFPDALPYMPRLGEEFLRRPAMGFPTITTSLWHHEDKVVLIGDACHAVIPFYGQGMNAGLEDCLVLDECLADQPGDWGAAFATYQKRRKPNTDVLAELSKQNFAEMRDTVRRPSVTARKEATLIVHKALGARFLPLYTMISHTRMPYAECVQRDRRQQRRARLLGMDLLVGALLLRTGAKALLAKARHAVGRRSGAPANANPEAPLAVGRD